jgi:hypothetical protein
MTTTRRISTALVASLLVFAACGGSDDTSEPDTTDEAGTTQASADDTTADDTTDDTTGDAPADTTDDSEAGGSGDFEPGDVEYRVVNVLDEPVDIYVRTTGLVEAFAIAEGVQPGEVTEFVAPPSDGVFLVTDAGAGDATCVSGCDHFIAELSALDGQGPVHTVVLYDDEFSGSSAFDLWEQPEPDETNANAMPPADPASGVVVVTGIALTDADFGLRLAVDGTPGCLEPFNLENILVGGNQTPAYTYDGDSVDLVLHANTDRECVEEPVGGAFTVEGGAGTRSHLILTGSPGDMDAIVVTMVDGEGPSDSDGDTGDGSGDEGAASSEDRDLAIELMTAEVAANLPLDDAQSACTAELLVDAIGVDVLLVDGELVDLDSLPSEFDAPAEQAIITAIGECDIDPALLGG